MNSGLFGFSNLPTSLDRRGGLISRVEFNSSGKYTIPAGTQFLRIFLIGGGGGGGGGARQSSAASAGGGGGAQPAQSVNILSIAPEFFGGIGTTLAITLGAGGSGGAGGSSNGASGSNGTAGGNSTISIDGSPHTLISALGGPRGLGGTLSAGGQSDTSLPHYFYPLGMTLAGISSITPQGGFGAAPSNPVVYATPQVAVGGGGGGISATADFAGGSLVNYSFANTIARITSKNLAANANVIAGGAGGANGESSFIRLAETMGAGVGGGGGGGGFNRNAGNGGNGFCGSGGGGGGASSTGFVAGNGGNGGNGYCCIEAYA